jgi:hypothetical protein
MKKSSGRKEEESKEAIKQELREKREPNHVCFVGM